MSGRAHPGQLADDRRLGRMLAIAVKVTFAVALAGVVAPGAVGIGLATAAVGMVITMPIARVFWLIARWAREGDKRFVVIGAALIAVVAIGFTLALLRA